MMQSFYFTYGSEGHPFVGGWTEIVAQDFHDACSTFKRLHPCKEGKLLNCASVYTEEEFKRTSMFYHGNRGAKCHEYIYITKLSNRKEH